VGGNFPLFGPMSIVLLASMENILEGSSSDQLFMARGELPIESLSLQPSLVTTDYADPIP
jgi:hypothetical protein